MPEQFADDRIQRYLDTKEVVVLAVARPDGAPLALPMWFVHTPEALFMVTEEWLPKVRFLRADPRVCVLAESGARAADIRRVTVEGRAEFADPGAHPGIVGRLLEKYDLDLARRWGGPAIPPDRVLIRVVPERVRSAGLIAAQGV